MVGRFLICFFFLYAWHDGPWKLCPPARYSCVVQCVQFVISEHQKIVPVSFHGAGVLWILSMQGHREVEITLNWNQGFKEHGMLSRVFSLCLKKPMEMPSFLLAVLSKKHKICHNASGQQSFYTHHLPTLSVVGNSSRQQCALTLWAMDLGAGYKYTLGRTLENVASFDTVNTSDI